MKKVNINDIKEQAWQSPGGKYAVSFKGISEALGREPDSLDLSERHPFDLEWNRVPAGKQNFPYHAHSAQWELYLVISGQGRVRHKDGTTDVLAGDAFIFGPDELHQLINSGRTASTDQLRPGRPHLLRGCGQPHRRIGLLSRQREVEGQ